MSEPLSEQERLDLVASTVPHEVYVELERRCEQIQADIADVTEQLLDALDRLADAEGDLAVAEAVQRTDAAAGDREVLPAEVVRAREDVARRERAVIRAGRRVEHLETQLAGLDDAAATAAGELAAVQPQDPAQAEPPALLFDNVYVFVPEFLSKIHARPVGSQVTTFRWCSRWWEHAEAVSRLEALWKAFETLRHDPGTGAAVWWRDFVDPTMGALCGPEGPFRQCSDTDHKLIKDLPTVAAPDLLLAR